MSTTPPAGDPRYTGDVEVGGPADVRELTSSAIDRTRSIGWRVNSATESTAATDAIDTSGTTA